MKKRSPPPYSDTYMYITLHTDAHSAHLPSTHIHTAPHSTCTLTYRHPSNLMLDRLTGRILHIDFGDCFEVAMTREKFPEKIPFRLTRMLTNAMEVHVPPQTVHCVSQQLCCLPLRLLCCHHNLICGCLQPLE